MRVRTSLRAAGLAAFAAATAALAPGRLPAQATTTDLVFVSVPVSGSVALIDREAMTPVGTIDVGGEPRGVALTPDGQRLLVADQDESSLHVVNVASRLVEASVTIFGGTGAPRDVVVSPDGTTAYVSARYPAAVAVVDLVHLTDEGSVLFPYLSSGMRGEGLAITPDGSKVFAVDVGDSLLHTFDTATRTFVGMGTQVPGGPQEIAISADGTRGIVVGIDGPAVFLTATGEVVATLADRGTHLDVTVVGDLAYATNGGYDSGTNAKPAAKGVRAGPIEGQAAVDVYRLSTASLVASHALPQGTWPQGLAAYDATHLYTCMEDDTTGHVLAVDGTTGATSATASTGLVPWRAAVRRAPVAPGTKDHVYVTVPDDGNVVVVDRATMTVLDTISVGGRPLGLAVTPDGATVVVAVASSNVAAIIDTDTRTVVGQVPILSYGGDPWDVAVTADGAKAYVTSPYVSRVHVLDLVNRVQTKELVMSPWQSTTPYPLGVAISPDGSAVYALDSAAGIAERIAPAYDGWTDGAVFLPHVADEIAIAPDGSRAIAVGRFAPAFFDMATAQLVPTTLSDLGRGVDVAASGDYAFVANQDPEGGPYVDVYRFSTAELVSSFAIQAEAYLEAVAAYDASHVYACMASGETAGGLVELDPLGETTGRFADVGGRPFRAVIVRASEVSVVSFFLPTAVRMKLAGAGKDALATSGLFDDGDLPADFTEPVTLEVGDFTRTFQLQPNRKKTAYSYRSPELTISITPNLRGSSRGRFTLKIQKTTLQGLVAPDGPCELHFRATGLPDMAGTVVLEDCGYRRARRRGALTSPPFFAGLGQFTLKGEGQDSCIVRWGFSAGPTTPQTLGDVRVGIGALDLRIPGDAFVRSTKKGEELFAATLVEGASKITVTLDYKRELARVVAKNVELGALEAGMATDFVLDPGNGSGVFRNHVRLGGIGRKVFY